jgi:glycosyltransferase involved in cell wall biosynthesis
MHIGIDIRSLASPTRTGVGEYTHDFLEALFTIDTTNHYSLFANARPELTKYIPPWHYTNVQSVTTHYPNKALNVSTKIFSRPKIDRIINTKRSFPEPLDYFFSPNLNFTSLSQGVRHILTIHDLSFEFFPDFFSRKQRWWHRAVNPRKICREAYKIITPSENTARDLTDQYAIPSEKIVIIPHGIRSAFSSLPSDKSRLDLQQKYNLPHKYILFLGTIEPRKNILGLLQGFELATHHIPPDIHLVIAGSNGWNNQAIFAFYKNTPLKNRIHHIGYIEPNYKPLLYREAQLFVYPSFYEGFGFPVLEAMASGTPVITSSRSSLPEVGGSAVYYTNPNKPASVAEGICRIITNPELKNRLQKDGLLQSNNFSWETAAKKFLAAILC